MLDLCAIHPYDVDMAQFVPGVLLREIEKRGLTYDSFAELAGVSRDTIYRANKGVQFGRKARVKIITALGENPAVEAPAGLEEAS